MYVEFVLVNGVTAVFLTMPFLLSIALLKMVQKWVIYYNGHYMICVLYIKYVH